MVIWVIGLAGSGKSTISKIIHRSFLKKNIPTVLIDGDEIRKIFANDLGYSIKTDLKMRQESENYVNFLIKMKLM